MSQWQPIKGDYIDAAMSQAAAVLLRGIASDLEAGKRILKKGHASCGEPDGKIYKAGEGPPVTVTYTFVIEDVETVEETVT
jgi:hypothetical protein